MGTESPDVWPRTAEISFGNTEVTRHEFYECFEHDSNESDSIIDAVSRLPGRAFCVFRIGFKTVKDHIEFLNKFSAKESVVISCKEVRIRVRVKIVRKPQETGPTGGGKMPIAPTVDADSFPELAQRSTMSTIVVFDKAPEDPISKPDEAEIETGVARLDELGSPTREMDNDVEEEMDATELCSVSNPGEDISFSDGSIQPGPKLFDLCGTMAAKWLNSVDIDFGVQFPRLSMRTVHGFVRSLKVEPQDLLGLVAVLDTRNQRHTPQVFVPTQWYRQDRIEGKEVGVVIRDRNIQEKFVRIAGIPQNLDLGVVQTRLKNFGNVIEARWERYRVSEDEVLYPVLATWMIVRMTVTKNIPSYITIGSYRAMVKYDGQKPTCRLCDDETHFSYNCPTLKRNQEPTIVQKPVPKMTKKTETIKQNPVVIPLAKHSMVSKVPLEGELQDSPSGGTQNLETETMECSTLTSSLTVPSEDNPSKPIMKSQMTAPDTETQDQEPMTIIMESMEPDMGEIEIMGPDKTKDPLRIPTVPRNKRFKPTLTAQNSKPSSGIHRLIKT
ncbi:hypothetical protein OUZ56_023307 [Daphnia magna]|uniref:DUF4283 domain-containing protein n=1 Tax=Daphnia magna TaxID=35525 RepID=A0ABR0AYV2_9CRUS|nr:hypothetical protein OUZ56_023307 [Daphnia magna]